MPITYLWSLVASDLYWPTPAKTKFEYTPPGVLANQHAYTSSNII